MKLDSYTPVKHWLEWFTDDEMEHRSFHLPFEVGPYTVATDSRMIVAEPGSFGFGPYAGKRPVYGEIAGKILVTNDKLKWKSVDTAKLIAALPPITITIQACGECDGIGEVDHECTCPLCDEDTADCEYCGGTGQAKTVSPEHDFAVVFDDHPVDLNYLAYLFKHAPDAGPSVDLAVVEKDGATSNPRLHIRTPNWLAVLMCVEGKAEKKLDLTPELQEATA